MIRGKEREREVDSSRMRAAKREKNIPPCVNPHRVNQNHPERDVLQRYCWIDLEGTKSGWRVMRRVKEDAKHYDSPEMS